VMAALVSAPISAHLLGGSAGGGAQSFQERLLDSGANLLQATTLYSFFSDPFDKMVSFLVVWLILLKLPKSLPRQLAPGRAISRSFRSPSRYGVAALLSFLALAVAVVFLPAFGPSVYAVFYIAVVLSAWNGGLGPGLLAMGIGATAVLMLPIYRADS